MNFKIHAPGGVCECDEDTAPCCPGGIAPAFIDLDLDLSGGFCDDAVSVYQLDNSGECFFNHTEVIDGAICGAIPPSDSYYLKQIVFTLDEATLTVVFQYFRTSNNSLYASATYTWSFGTCDLGDELTFDSASDTFPITFVTHTTHTAEFA